MMSPDPRGAIPAAPEVSETIMARLRRLLTGKGLGGIVVRGALWALVITLAGMLIRFGSQVILARALGPAEYGIYLYFFAWLNVVVLVGTLEFPEAAIRFIGAYSGTKQWAKLRGFVTKSHQIVAGTSLSLAIVGMLVALAFRRSLGPTESTILLLLSLQLPILAFLKLKSSCLHGLKHIPHATSPMQVFRPLFFASMVAVAAFAMGWTLVAVDAMALQLVATAGALLLVAKFLRDRSPREIAEVVPAYDTRVWMGTALGLLAITGAQILLSTQADVIIVGTLLGKTEAGLYGVASQLAVLVTFGVAAIMFISRPMFADLYAQRSLATLQRLVVHVGRASLLVALPVILLMVFIGRALLGLFGPEFVAAYTILLVLVGGQTIQAGIGILAGFLLTMTGYHREAAWIIGATALFNLALTLVLTPLFGAIGTASATTAALAVRSVILVVFAWRLLKIRVAPL